MSKFDYSKDIFLPGELNNGEIFTILKDLQNGNLQAYKINLISLENTEYF